MSVIPSTQATPPGPSPLWAAFALGVGSLFSALMQSLVIPIQGTLPQLLGTSASNASWAITATLLAAAVAMPVAGRLADVYGAKKILVVSAAALAAGSLVAALSVTVTPFLIGRALQGVSMGYIPVAISLVRQIAPAKHAAGAVAGISATLGVGGALGLPLAALIAQSFDWHALFWLSTVLAVATLAITFRFVPATDENKPGRIDVVGIIGLVLGLGATLVGVSKGSSWGWGDARTLVSISFGVLVLLAWGWFELRHAEPLMDLRTMASRPVLFTNLAAVLIGFGMMAQSIVMPQLLQLPAASGHGLGQSMLAAGLWMVPAGLMMLLLAPLSAALMKAIGPRRTLAVGAVMLGLGYLAATNLTEQPWQVMLASMIASAGVAIGYASMPTLILDHVPAHEAGAGVGGNALMRSIGSTLAGAVMAALLTSRTVDVGGGAMIPSADAFGLCFMAGAGAAFAGALAALLIPRSKTPARSTAPIPGVPQVAAERVAEGAGV